MPKHPFSLTRLWILTLEPERLKNRQAITENESGMKGLPTDAQAACCFRYSASKRTPFFELRGQRNSREQISRRSNSLDSTAEDEGFCGKAADALHVGQPVAELFGNAMEAEREQNSFSCPFGQTSEVAPQCCESGIASSTSEARHTNSQHRAARAATC